MIKTARREPSVQIARQVKQWTMQLSHKQFGDFCPVDTWTPQVNLYQLEDRVEICVDLAGIDPGAVDVRIEPGRLTISGERRTPEPSRQEGEAMRIVAMEIDHGRYCRTIALPENLDLRKSESSYQAGLLWVRLPRRPAAKPRH